MKLYQLYEVTWIDSANHAIGWEDGTDIGTKVATIVSVGFLWAKNKKAITLVQNVCTKGPGSPSGCNAISIPKGCIKSTRKLKASVEAWVHPEETYEAHIHRPA